MITTKTQILPNFLIVGAGKSGTTSLYYYLKDHPDIFFSPIKEPCFFSAQILKLPQAGTGDERKYFANTFDNYLELFKDARDEKAIGEASADTLYYYNETIPMIHKYLGDPKIIIILRNPVDRAFSAYLHLLRENRETLSFEEGLKKEEERIKNNWCCMWHYTKRGMYFNQVDAFMKSFSNVKVVLYDDFKRDSRHEIRSICKFLEVDTAYIPPHDKTHFNVSGIPRYGKINNLFVKKNIFQKTIRTVGSFLLTEDGWVRLRENLRARIMTKPRMKTETRLYLQDMFREDILKLQQLTEMDLSVWLGQDNSN